ncbi:hypothetical protein INR49_017163, partial [Caranx melampygus]
SRTLLQGSPRSSDTVQGDGHAEGTGVEGFPEQDQLCAQHGRLLTVDVNSCTHGDGSLNNQRKM